MYHPAHGGLGWSRQKPVERATQRNETAIDCWRSITWAEVKKAEQEGRTHNLAELRRALRLATWRARVQVPLPSLRSAPSPAGGVYFKLVHKNGKLAASTKRRERQ